MPAVQETPATIFPPMSRAITGVRFIVSVFPVEQTHTQVMGYGVPTVVLKAATKDSYTILPIHDTFQRVMYMANQDEDSREIREAPLTAESLAMSMVEKWTNSLSKFGGPGIGLLPLQWPSGQPTSYGEYPNQKVYEDAPEFKAFVSRLVAKQRDMANWCIQNASDNFINGKSERIGEIHRILAAWQLGDGVKNLKWYNFVGEENSNKPCLACKATIEFGALVCANCRTDLVEYVMKYNITGEDAAVDAMVERIRTGKKNVAQPTPKASLEADPVSQPEGAVMPLPQKPIVSVSPALTAKVIEKLSETDKSRYAAIPTDAKKAEFILKVAAQYKITED